MTAENWVEKFRPNKLDDIIGQDNIINSLKNTIYNNNLPHLIFFGPSGCGKTSTILALSKELFGKYYNDRVIELNASDERGIKIVREKIKTFAKMSVNDNKDIPPWKIIILDEADNMTSDSQFALRKIMEDYSKITRFCIICNYYYKIIDPIISRCSLFRFKPISRKEIIDKLINICKIENIECSQKNIEKIIDISRGDLRKAVSLLQKCKINKNIISKNNFDKQNNINSYIIDELSGIINKKYFKKIIKYSIKSKVDKLNNILNNISDMSYSITNMIEPLCDIIIKHKNISDENKMKIINKIVDIDQFLLKGSDEYIQLYRFAYYIMFLYN
jgi:replication factor C subunit 2/4